MLDKSRPGIIVSFATIPTRINYIEPVINSLLEQTIEPDEIHIQTPAYCKKTKSGFDYPTFLRSYESKIKIKIRDTDFGSVNKWYYPLKDYSGEKDILIFIVDDDCSYQKNSMEILLKRYQSNEGSYCFSGGIFPKKPEILERVATASKVQSNAFTFLTDNSFDIKVDTVQGFGMYVLNPSWIVDSDLNDMVNEDSFSQADDVIVSGLLEKAGIERIQVGPYQIPKILEQSEINPIHGDGRLLRMSKNALKEVQAKLQVWDNIEMIDSDASGKNFLNEIKRRIPERWKNKLKSICTK